MVEDDDKLAQLLQNRLERFGYRVVLARDFAHIDQEVYETGPHLILLDINLPQYDGFYWCRMIRRFSTVPIVFLSARTGAMDKVLALEHGADDYLSKPFHPEVMMAKLRALLRRTYGEYAGESVSREDAIVRRGLVLDLRRMRVMYGGAVQALTVTEMELMHLLLEAHERPLSRAELLTAVWSDTSFVDDNTLTVNIARLRAKLALLGLAEAIQTIRGHGYRLSLPSDPHLVARKDG